MTHQQSQTTAAGFLELAMQHIYMRLNNEMWRQHLTVDHDRMRLVFELAVSELDAVLHPDTIAFLRAVPLPADILLAERKNRDATYLEWWYTSVWGWSDGNPATITHHLAMDGIHPEDLAVMTEAELLMIESIGRRRMAFIMKHRPTLIEGGIPTIARRLYPTPRQLDRFQYYSIVWWLELNASRALTFAPVQPDQVLSMGVSELQEIAGEHYAEIKKKRRPLDSPVNPDDQLAMIQAIRAAANAYIQEHQLAEAQVIQLCDAPTILTLRWRTGPEYRFMHFELKCQSKPYQITTNLFISRFERGRWEVQRRHIDNFTVLSVKPLDELREWLDRRFRQLKADAAMASANMRFVYE